MIDKLIQYGLSEKEANIYLICLKIGQGTANRIAELSSNPRSTTYDILENLKTLGLISSCIIEKKINYISNEPETLFTQLNERKKIIEEIIPDLKQIQNKIEEKPKALVYQGKLAVTKLLDEILDNAKKIKVIGSHENALEKIGYKPITFWNKRLDRKIKIKQILEDSNESRLVTKDKYTKVKFSKKLNDSKEAIFIFDKYVYHIILQYEISAIKIESKDHAKAMTIMFDEFWKTAK